MVMHDSCLDLIVLIKMAILWNEHFVKLLTSFYIHVPKTWIEHVTHIILAILALGDVLLHSGLDKQIERVKGASI